LAAELKTHRNHGGQNFAHFLGLHVFGG